ncbi:UDP-N-acetylmuramoyl-tripeptide--D-alanyl-D-alanine ligase [Bifidobacterium animalis subsp. lactis ATCC 27673]|uniref:UDP-N-acetylmuramoyl-tripeptide--D-alanyl-D- alanine ligase n=1 Tax=Bifidobacterium animalis TaxID=28025 RepID=UPI0003B02280|nr:UDP-N-acetylmuramoyl-tripeptide--D-alanyl-D-alanine ligase [Bifidobacterium animalis]AGW85393.1 UDP-N-acetylmuramoyl-tripeptide--D-alanyl-D-alanine ligase [Bifidobacterium animalis subsp. lactis ATCC 27673]KOA45597.1 UDP-N-acetylmuramoyl-tripeptide--D-alanyl-D-alanine ligase [Bifidobacterium animalis subsp. lactis ATCC 27673]RYM91931.1 UDP-N-acetylmuramoyl-tripeptide--D-alanyl-D- alan ine ligase [Bifidobacterium animalis subsp. lactis]RYM92087.1 UDP-N-acetylmuramoyl-tripeptide--D-alanyl-D- a
MMRMTLAQMVQAVHGSAEHCDCDDLETVTATSVVTDSRQVVDGALFVAIAGEHVDGHDFVDAAARQGAAAALVEREIESAPIAQIVVPDTVAALGALAKANLEARKAIDEPFTIIGITGSVGKTTTKDLLHALLSTQGETVAPKGSFNNEIGLPLTALKVGERTRYLVAEMGANHIGEIARLTKIAPPDIAVVLKVGVAHLGEFGSVERIAQAKSEIVRGEAPNAITVLNADDERVAAMSGIAKGDVFWFGIDKAQAHDIDGYMAADDIALDDLGHPVFELVSSQGVEQRVSLGIGGRHNVMNALAAASVAKLLGMPLERIAQVLADTRRISPHRMAVSEVERDGARFTLIDDSFNANPDSMRAGIDGLMAWRSQEDQQPYRVAVLGSMLELGSDEHNLHRTIGAYALDGGVDALICVGGGDDASLNALAQDIADGGTEAKDADDMRPVRAVKTTQQADDLIRALNAEHPDMLVLLKGSHASGLSALATQWAAEAE